MDKVKVLFLKSLYPYSAGDIGELKGAVAQKRLDRGYIELVEEKEIKQPKANKSMEKKAKKTK